MQKVGITGVAGTLGRRVAAALLAQGAHVTGIDVTSDGVPDGVDLHRGDVVSADLVTLFRGHDTIVHLAGVPVGGEHPASAGVNVGGTRRVLEAAGDDGVGQVVLLSSATVYGAWPDNPVPLTEDAPLRPTPSFAYAAQKAELERLAGAWAQDHPHVRVAVLRPAITVGPGVPSWLFEAVAPGIPERIGAALPATQFVHVDDVVSAIVHAAEHRLEGTYNVAPDDWIPADEIAPLLGPAPRIPLPDRVWGGVAAVRRWTRRHEIPGALAFARHPCVVAPDRLRATGWAAQSTSAEALLSSRPPSPVASFAARHRQEVTLGAVAGGAIALLAVVGHVLWRRRRP